MNIILKYIRALTVIPHCIACGKTTDGHERQLCSDCRKRYLTEKAVSCTLCGFPASECRCGVSVDGKNYRVIHCVPYDQRQLGVAARLIYAAKSQYSADLFDFISHECYRALSSAVRLDDKQLLITWIPRRRISIIKNGHDQSKIIAKRLARILKCECRGLFINRSSLQQKSLSKKERFKNAKDAYSLRRSALHRLNGKTVIAVDDIITTGATLTAALRLLLETDATEIIPLTYAKTDRKFRKYRLK